MKLRGSLHCFQAFKAVARGWLPARLFGSANFSLFSLR